MDKRKTPSHYQKATGSSKMLTIPGNTIHPKHVGAGAKSKHPMKHPYKGKC